MDIIENAAVADGIPPLSEQFLLGLHDPRLGHRHMRSAHGLLAIAPDNTAEIVVDPAFRRLGEARSLLAQASYPSVWAHGNLPAAQATAQALGYSAIRQLLVLARPQAPIGPVELPEGFYLSSLAADERVRGSQALQALLDCNNAAFDWHPEQGGWDAERLERALEPAWVDKEAILTLWDEKEDRLAGFHWLKIDPPTHEIYVIGIDPHYQGRGLSRPLIQAGMEKMAAAPEIILYVEADNSRAVQVYSRLGFERKESHVLYSRQD